MNCVNAQIKGGDGSEMDDLPAMFVANLASIDTCPTTEQYNVKFPDPGKYVTTKTEGNPYPLAVPTGAGCSAAVHGKSPASSSASASAPSAPAASSTKATTASPTKAPAASPTKVSTPPASSAPAATQVTSPGKCPTGQTACSTPGDITASTRPTSASATLTTALSRSPSLRVPLAPTARLCASAAGSVN